LARFPVRAGSSRRRADPERELPQAGSDTRGHDIRDELLIAVAEQIRQQLLDCLARPWWFKARLLSACAVSSQLSAERVHCGRVRHRSYPSRSLRSLRLMVSM
jgi:hypothetical protein